jgi:hypothetical protein
MNILCHTSLGPRIEHNYYTFIKSHDIRLMVKSAASEFHDRAEYLVVRDEEDEDDGYKRYSACDSDIML